MTVPVEYSTPEGLRTLANFLRSSNGIKVKSGIAHDKRIDYFKGKKFIECLLEAKKWPKSLPKITDENIAKEIANLLIEQHFFHRFEKMKERKGFFQDSKNNSFDEKGYFVWMFAGNMMWSNIATGLIIVLVIGFTLLPIWPDYAKKILWYLSVTFLIGTLSFCLIRMLLFVISWLFGYEFWIFPRLFDESLSFQDSFKPIYTFEKGTNGQGYYRIGLILLIVGFTYWAFTQPTEFDEILKVQKEFIDDLYSGKLLADVAFDPREHIANAHNKKVPKLEDLLKDLEKDELSITEKAPENTMEEGDLGEQVDQETNKQPFVSKKSKEVEDSEEILLDGEEIGLSSQSQEELINELLQEKEIIDGEEEDDELLPSLDESLEE